MIITAQIVKNHAKRHIQFINPKTKDNPKIINNFLYNSLNLYLSTKNEVNTITFIKLKNTNINIYPNKNNNQNGIQIILNKNNNIIIGSHIIVKNQYKKLFQVCILKLSEISEKNFCKYK